VLETLERQHGHAALTLLREKVPRRLSPHASLARLRTSAALDTILLDDGEELLLFIDGLLGDGSGRVLEGVGQDLAGRALSQGGVVRFGDLHGTVARLQAFLDHPFVDTPTLFDLKRTDLGFVLTVGVVGRPRATRLLRHLSVGAVQAAERVAREGSRDMQLVSDVVADRAVLRAQYQRTEPRVGLRSESEAAPASVRRPAASVRPPSLSAEVERILTSHRRPASQPPRTSPAAPPPVALRSRQPPREGPASEIPPAHERTSDVQPVAKRTSSLEGSLEHAPAATSERKVSKA
jgi:hypothetical protein